jgi:hypothetical protein
MFLTSEDLDVDSFMSEHTKSYVHVFGTYRPVAPHGETSAFDAIMASLRLGNDSQIYTDGNYRSFEFVCHCTPWATIKNFIHFFKLDKAYIGSIDLVSLEDNVVDMLTEDTEVNTYYMLPAFNFKVGKESHEITLQGIPYVNLDRPVPEGMKEAAVRRFGIYLDRL